jgi:two-component sensor histidine kinase
MGGALLGDLLSVLLAPYEAAPPAGRIRVAVPMLRVGEGAATALALTIHELATNAVKYGALAAETGVLDVSAVVHDGSVEITWTERGGPPAAAGEVPKGYGSRLIDRTVNQQLGGSIGFNWSADGVIVTLRLSRDRLAA